MQNWLHLPHVVPFCVIGISQCSLLPAGGTMQDHAKLAEAERMHKAVHKMLLKCHCNVVCHMTPYVYCSF